MSDKIKPIFHQRITGDTTLVQNNINTSCYIKNIIVKEVGNVNTFRLKINDEVVSDDYDIKFGEIVTIKFEDIIGQNETLKIELDKPAEADKYNEKIAAELKQRIAEEMPDAQIVFSKYGIICVKFNKKYYFYNVQFERILSGQKLDILLDTGRYTYFFKLDDVVYTIKDGALVNLATFSNLRVIDGERYVFEDAQNYKVQIYNSRKRTMEYTFNGAILDYSPDNDILIIREDAFEKNNYFGVGKEARRKSRVLTFNLRTGEETTVFTLGKVYDQLSAAQKLAENKDDHPYSLGKLWSSICTFIDANTVIFTFIARDTGEQSFVARPTFVYVYDLNTKSFIKEYPCMTHCKFFITKGHIIFTNSYNDFFPEEIIYNYKTDQEKRRSYSNWPVTVTVLDDKIYMRRYKNSYMAVCEDIETYKELTFDQIKWSKEAFYTYDQLNTCACSINSNGELLYSTSTYPEQNPYRLVKDWSILPKEVTAENGYKICFVHNKKDVTKTSHYNAVAAKMGNFYVGLSSGMMYLSLAYSDAEVSTYDRQETENSLFIPNVFMAQPSGEYMTTYNVDRNITNNLRPMVYPAGYQYVPRRQLDSGFNNIVFVGGTDDDHVVALWIGNDCIGASPLLIKLTAEGGKYAGYEIKNIMDIKHIYSFYGNKEDGYYLLTDNGKIYFETFKEHDISEESIAKHMKFYGGRYFVDPSKMSKVNERGISTETEKEGDQLFVRVTGVVSTEDTED